MSRRQARSEQGAVAIMVAAMAVVLFGVGALAVDLGNAYARDRDVQNQADFAALSAGAKLPGSTENRAEIVAAAADYLNKNQPQHDIADEPGSACLDGASSTCVTASTLEDDDSTNGEICFGEFAWDDLAGQYTCPETEDPTQLSVLSPEAEVDFGLAAILDSQDQSEAEDDDGAGTHLQATATVSIFSPVMGVLPMFAVDQGGCDYGPQTIIDTTKGKTTNPSPENLAWPDHPIPSTANTAVLNTLNPAGVPLDASGVQLTITGSNLSGVNYVGFFRSGSPPPAETFIPASGTDTSITVTIPDSVTAIEEAWYVRVFKGPAPSPGQWSPMAGAKPLKVGDAVLECAAAATDGNFGTIKIPREAETDSSKNGWLPNNIAAGLKAPITLAVYPNPESAPVPCGPSPGVVSVLGSPQPGTNCLDTDTGYAENPTTAGLVKGTDKHLGRLDRDTTEGCDPYGGSEEVNIGVPTKSGANKINNDILSCFFTNDTVTVGDVTSPSFAGPPGVISEDVFKSPRFAWIPIFGVNPSSGGSGRYPIVDMRPAFITDQPLHATRSWTDSIPTSRPTQNGLVVDGNGITRVKVVFFNENALPETIEDDGGPVTDYLGYGPKIVRLTD